MWPRGSTPLTPRSQRRDSDVELTERAEPCLVARTYTLTHPSSSHVPTAITNPRMGEALFGGDDLHTHAPLYTFRERSQTLIWAKPCLAGRPTALVRTQSPETHTSRGRPSGMELPEYPVVALTPTPWDQDGPALPPPARSFPVLVTRYASHRVFSQTRSSLFFPPIFLFLDRHYFALQIFSKSRTPQKPS
jgi:hypothetical protein